MDLTIDDFRILAEERSDRDVRIAQLEMELAQQRRAHEAELALLQKERDGLWAENQRQECRIAQLETDFENMRFENHWMKQYILLSVERVRLFFTHISNIEVLSAIKSFVMQVLPKNATPEQIAYASQMMELPMVDSQPKVVNVAGNYTDVHDNGQVNTLND